jgi:hypothetical protein
MFVFVQVWGLVVGDSLLVLSFIMRRCFCLVRRHYEQLIQTRAITQSHIFVMRWFFCLVRLLCTTRKTEIRRARHHPAETAFSSLDGCLIDLWKLGSNGTRFSYPTMGRSPYWATKRRVFLLILFIFFKNVLKNSVRPSFKFHETLIHLRSGFPISLLIHVV